MQKSLFKKYFAMVCVVMITSLSCIGALLIAQTANLWINDVFEVLEETSTTVLSRIDLYPIGTYSNDDFKIELADDMNFISNVNDTHIIVVKENGEIFASSKPSSAVDLLNSSVVPKNAMDIFSDPNKNNKDKSNVENFFKQPVYYYCVPFEKKDTAVDENTPANTVLTGYVIVYVPSVGLNEYEIAIFKMYGISSFIALIFGFIVLYKTTKRLTSPLQQMSDAAKRFSKGDFSARVDVSPLRQDEIGHLAVAFNDMAKSLSILEHMRRSFVANVSHELKTPMTSISGFIDGMIDGTIPPENRDHYLALVSQETKRLSRLVTSMLNLAKLESGELNLNPIRVDLTDMLFKILINFESKIDDKQLNILGLQDTEKTFVEVDHDLFYQVLYNIIENAIKFSPEKGYIKFELSTNNSDIKICIENNGEGIPEIQLTQIFDKFYKTDNSRSMDKTGLGLGLYIVKTIVELHKGKIIAESSESQFTRITIEFPLKQNKLELKDDNNV